MPEGGLPLFASIPHSGIKIPPEADWLKDIPPSILKEDTDAFVDALYLPALREFRIPALIFEWNRYAVDLNRFANDISPLSVNLSEPINALGPTKRKSPSDVHWSKTTKGDVLIKTPLLESLHQELINKYFAPFHQRIQKEFERLRAKGKAVYMLDLHSMPSKGRAFHKDPGRERAPVVIGDNEGRAASPAFRDLALKAFRRAGFEPALNQPYKGGALTQTYGRPEQGQEVLQIELNRKLYMDEISKNKTAGFPEIQGRLRRAIGFIAKNLSQL